MTTAKRGRQQQQQQQRQRQLDRIGHSLSSPRAAVLLFAEFAGHLLLPFSSSVCLAHCARPPLFARRTPLRGAIWIVRVLYVLYVFVQMSVSADQVRANRRQLERGRQASNWSL